MNIYHSTIHLNQQKNKHQSPFLRTHLYVKSVCQIRTRGVCSYQITYYWCYSGGTYAKIMERETISYIYIYIYVNMSAGGGGEVFRSGRAEYNMTCLPKQFHEYCMDLPFVCRSKYLLWAQIFVVGILNRTSPLIREYVEHRVSSRMALRWNSMWVCVCLFFLHRSGLKSPHAFSIWWICKHKYAMQITTLCRRQYRPTAFHFFSNLIQHLCVHANKSTHTETI